VSQLVLIGAGGHGRGTLEILKARRRAGYEVPEIAGFVDDSADDGDRSIGGVPLLGKVEWLLRRVDDGYQAIIALASSAAKKKIAQRLDQRGIAWQTAVHPSAIIGEGTSIGAGAIIGAGVVIAYDTVIGCHTTINLNATVGHDCRIGDYSTVAPGVNITGNVSLGECVEIQTNATLVPGLVIGREVGIGPGSVVLRDLAEGQQVFGNPARPVPTPTKVTR